MRRLAGAVMVSFVVIAVVPWFDGEDPASTTILGRHFIQLKGLFRSACRCIAGYTGSHPRATSSA
jgi:hypothetical protein